MDLGPKPLSEQAWVDRLQKGNPAHVQNLPGRCSCLMATKVVALLGKSLSGKVREPATGAVGLPSLCAPVATSSALNLLSMHSALSTHVKVSQQHAQRHNA